MALNNTNSFFTVLETSFTEQKSRHLWGFLLEVLGQTLFSSTPSLNPSNLLLPLSYCLLPLQDQISLCLPLIKTFGITVRASLDSPGQLLKILTSAQVLLLYEVGFTACRDQDVDIFGGYYSAPHRSPLATVLPFLIPIFFSKHRMYIDFTSVWVFFFFFF